MDRVTLTEEEIKGIHSFIGKASSIPAVECVYITGYLDEASSSTKIDVITVWNDSIAYKEKVYGKVAVDTHKEIGELREMILAKSGDASLERVAFNEEAAYNYLLALMHHREVIAEMSLASGTILFDRFGDFTQNQKRALELLTPYPNVLAIENIATLSDGQNALGGSVLKRQKEESSIE